jgi:ectoine hydroxylase-related dioxygenase (phytanoyl-CoA dioxygenase family)
MAGSGEINMSEPRLIRDRSATKLPLNELGWVGVDRNSAEVCRLRDYLAANNGIRGLEVVAHDEVERAARLLHRDGFVAVADVLDAQQLERLRAGCDEAIHEMMSLDGNRQGNRGSHRYSFGSASLTGSLLHRPEWAMLVDLPRLTPIITAIFGAPTYACSGGGGDFCLPGAVEYQRLHADMRDRVRLGDRWAWSFHDHRGALTYRDLPVPRITCNFPMVDFTRINGPIRQIPGTQHSRAPIPTLADEPEWMKLSTVCPVPAGSVLIRDIRAWHGGTPNLSDEVRAIPNVEYWAPWYREPVRVCMPRSIYDDLSEHGRSLCRYIVADSSETLETGFAAGLGGTPRLFLPENQDEAHG